jgi:hypothetical protein
MLKKTIHTLITVRKQLRSRTIVAFTCLSITLVLLAGRSATADLSEPTVGARYAEEISKNYDFKFGSNPFAPSNATSTTGTFIPAEMFVSSTRCGTCHTDAHAQWRQSAHYNLMLVFRKLGLKEEAKREGKVFAELKDDPGALPLSNLFLRKHPEMSNESVYWHIHDLAPAGQ